MLGLGDDRDFCRDREPGGLCLAYPHAPRARYLCRVRTAALGIEEAARQRAAERLA